MGGLRSRKLALAMSAYLMIASLFIGALYVTTFKTDEGQGVDEASRQFDDAQFGKDQVVLDQFLAPEMLFIRGSGRQTGKSEFIAAFIDPVTDFEAFEISDRRIVRLGSDAAIVSAKARIRGRVRGEPFVENIHFSDTFVREQGSWRVVHVQVTPVQPS